MTKKKSYRLQLKCYLFGDLTGVAASKWHMTPKEDQSQGTKKSTIIGVGLNGLNEEMTKLVLEHLKKVIKTTIKMLKCIL